MQVRKYIGVVGLSLSVLMACSSNQQSAETKDTTAVIADTVAVNELAFKDEKLKAIYNAYIKLKDELVATKFETAKPVAKDLADALKGFEGCENAVGISTKIAEAKDIKSQRTDFTALNVELIPVFKHAALTTGTIYVQHCPMANNGDGGDWLSSEKKIQNPYYGDEMMECGRVAEEIKAN